MYYLKAGWLLQTDFSTVSIKKSIQSNLIQFTLAPTATFLTGFTAQSGYFLIVLAVNYSLKISARSRALFVERPDRALSRSGCNHVRAAVLPFKKVDLWHPFAICAEARLTVAIL
jgi:hypothetical protein